MSDYYIQERQMIESGNAVFSSINEIEEKQARFTKSSRLKDTIAISASSSNHQNGRIASDRPFLPRPEKSKMPPNDLMEIAEAFSKAFQAMNQSVITQTQDYAGLQQLDQSQSQSVLSSTNFAITKEEHATKEAETIATLQKNDAKAMEIYSKYMFWVGIGLMALTVISAVFTGGASLMALGGEETMMEMGDLGLSTMDTVGDDAMPMDSFDSSSSNTDMEMTEEDESGTPNYMNQTARLMDEAPSNSTYENTDEMIDRDTSTNNKNTAKSEESFKKKMARTIFHKGIGMTATGGMLSPTLWRGIEGLRVASGYNKVAGAQAEIGGAMSTLQRNNMYFQFLQQLIQRSGGVIQEEASDASEVIETYGSITNAYRGISYGLANAV